MQHHRNGVCSRNLHGKYKCLVYDFQIVFKISLSLDPLPERHMSVITEPNNNTNNNKKRKTLKISKNRNFSAIIQAKVCIWNSPCQHVIFDLETNLVGKETTRFWPRATVLRDLRSEMPSGLGKFLFAIKQLECPYNFWAYMTATPGKDDFLFWSLT